MSRASALSLAALLALPGLPAVAHDFWIEPSTFEPEAVSTVRVGLRVGEAFDGRPVRRSSGHVERFVIAGPDGLRDIPGKEGLDPAGFAAIPASGLFVLGYASNRSSITLTAERFEAYLSQEGLERVSEKRASRGRTGKPGREIFSRSAKSIVVAGSAGRVGEGFDRLLGLPLELVPEANPYATDGSEPFPIRLLFRARPVAGVLVTARHRDRPEERITARTDENGLARLALDREGPWLINAVHMVEAQPEEDVDWESFWASLTFARRPARSSTVPAAR